VSKTIIITGGSRGIGAATARLAGERGWAVSVNFVEDEAAAKNTAREVEKAGGKAIAVRGNVAREDDVLGLFDETERAFGAIDGVVNNAAILRPAMRLAEMSLERMRELVGVNVIGAYLVAREAARRMATSRGGRGGVLVNLSSIAARLGGANMGVDYAGTKGAVEVMTRGLATELAPEGIRVNAIRPGTIDTDIHENWGVANWVRDIGPTIPAGRAGTASEAGEAIIWLLSDAASYVSGAILDVAGGR
jgi:NAD(P)-dependent dehydrogenase (short-subunit alcohol dehydrogenase family)